MKHLEVADVADMAARSQVQWERSDLLGSMSASPSTAWGPRGPRWPKRPAQLTQMVQPAVGGPWHSNTWHVIALHHHISSSSSSSSSSSYSSSSHIISSHLISSHIRTHSNVHMDSCWSIDTIKNNKIVIERNRRTTTNLRQWYFLKSLLGTCGRRRYTHQPLECDSTPSSRRFGFLFRGPRSGHGVYAQI